MKFNSIKITSGMFSRSEIFIDGSNLIFSQKNATGKTTLLRLMLYGIGYNVPSTKKLNFEKCETEVELDCAIGVIMLKRYNNYIVLVKRGQETIYLLPVEQEKLHKEIFGCDNANVVNNLLGAFYLDQEKGWTLLNRGTVIGKIPFNLEQLIRGLSDRNCDDLLNSLNKVEKDLSKYKKMRDISEYQKQINIYADNLVYDTYPEELKKQLITLLYQKSIVETEIKEIEATIKDNISFRKYIETMHLIVVSPKSGEEIFVNQETIKDYRDIESFIYARKRLKFTELSKLTKQIENLKLDINDDEPMLVNPGKTILNDFDIEISKIQIDAMAVENVINALENENKTLRVAIDTRTKSNNELISKMYRITYDYIKEFNIQKFAEVEDNYLFTSDLKSLSGAVLHLTVFAFKLAYIKIIEEVTGILLPIIIDSPSGREVDHDNVKTMIEVLGRDFANHQIIIASIHKDYNINNIKIIELKKSLLEIDF